jgi:hypothetical protein
MYHARPGQHITVAFYLAGSTVKRVSVTGATLVEQGSDPTGHVYVVTASPFDERLTITLEYDVPTVGSSGGTVSSGLGKWVEVPPGFFSETVGVHLVDYPTVHTPWHENIGIFYELFASSTDTGEPVHPTPGMSYTVSLTYGDADVPPGVDEADLGLFHWDGDAWVEEPTSTVYPDTNTIVATPDHFSLWGVLARRQGVYLPLALRGY